MEAKCWGSFGGLNWGEEELSGEGGQTLRTTLRTINLCLKPFR